MSTTSTTDILAVTREANRIAREGGTDAERGAFAARKVSLLGRLTGRLLGRLGENPAAPQVTAPAWATNHDQDSDGVTWRQRVAFDHVEVDGPDSLIVEAYVIDRLEVETDGVHFDRGTPEIQLTRSGDGDQGYPLRFQIGDARKVAAAIAALCDAVEGEATR